MQKAFQKFKNFGQYLIKEFFFATEFRGINEKSIIIDCGANVGDISLHFAKKGATVYAFEPNPFAFEILTKRLANYDKVTCINKGVWDKNTKANLFFHKNAAEDNIFWSFGSSIVQEKSNVNTSESVEVELIDLTEFIDELNVEIDVLKIDIEGAECEVLQKLIEKEQYKKIKTIIVETHDRKIPGLKQKTDHVRQMIKTRQIKNIELSWV